MLVYDQYNVYICRSRENEVSGTIPVERWSAWLPCY